MLAIHVEFLHGTFRGDPDGTANTGRLDQGEWPPSPARLFAALVAADGTRDACRFTDGAELEWLEQLAPPVIHASPRVCHQPLEDRFVVRPDRTNASHQEYVGRSGALSRGGVRVAPSSPHVTYVWLSGAPDDATLEALRLRAARVGYLGAADSPVRIRVTTEAFTPPATDHTYVEDMDGDVSINVPQQGDLARWDHLYDRWIEHGPSVSRAQSPALAHPVRYRSPRSSEREDRGEVVAWLRLPRAVSGRRISTVTALFKEAVLSQHQRIHGAPPPMLHGHVQGKGYEIARYLALPDVGAEWSRGRIHGLALWLPPGCDPITSRRARDAARSIRRLRGPGVDAEVVPRDNESRPRAAHPNRWLRSSRGWATAVPAIHERRRRLDLAEVARWCEHAGLPQPAAFRSERTPFVRGALDLAPVEVNRPKKPALPYSHIALYFEQAIPGPVVVGSGRQRGFGLCVPLDETDKR